MKCTIATMRRAIAHQEKAKKRKDPIAKSHYSMGMETVRGARRVRGRNEFVEERATSPARR